MDSLRFALPRLIVSALALSLAAPTWGAGTPDPSNIALSTTNRNQLIGILGPDRGFGFGDYVTDRVSGLQRAGATVPYRYFVEVPPGQTQLVLQIFDADVGAGDNLGTPAVNEDLHDQDNTTAGYGQVLIYQLFDPAGSLVASRTLAGQDCDPGVGGLQNFCDNAWSDLGAFTVASPSPGHWLFTVTSPNSGLNDEDDANSFGLRAHDGDPTAGGTDYNIYADTYIGLGQVYPANAGADPGLSRVHDLYPFLRRDCSCDSNDWDSDSSAPIDESTSFVTRKGITPSGSNGTLSGATVWRQNLLGAFSSATDATDYGLWRLRWTTGRFNFLTFYMGDESAADPSNAAPGPGNGQEPNQQPEAGAIRLYFPADGSRFFGLAGGANDVVIAPAKPWVGQSWALVAGQPPVEANVTSIARVTITVANPTDFPIQLSATTAGLDVITVTLPDNGGQTSYVPGSAATAGASSTANSVTGTGPWTIVFAPGVIAANATATLTYDVAISPTPTGLPKSLALTGSAATGTAGAYLDETCANGAGGASACSVAAQAGARLTVGPLCPLAAQVTSAPAIGLAKRLNGAIVDNGNGSFNVPIRLVVENLGTEILDPISVQDDLFAVFPPPATYSIAAGPSVTLLSGTGGLTANAFYNGSADTELLTAASSLGTASTGQIDFTVRVDPNGLPGPFFNQASASGDTPLGGTVDDSSDDGADPDTDGDGNADEPGSGCPSILPATNCENDPTPIALGEDPEIGIAKRVNPAVIDNDDGTFTVFFEILVENLGNVDLDTVQVVDNLAATFPAPVEILIASPPAAGIVTGIGSMVANPAYNGVTDTNLLVAASSALTVGAVGRVVFAVRFDPVDEPGPFSNTAVASAQSPQNATVTDTSDDGTNPDPDGDGEGDEPGENDPTPVGVPAAPAIGVAKQVSSAVVDNGDGTFTLTFQLRVENLGNVLLDNVRVVDDLAATFPAPASVVSAGPVSASVLAGDGTLAANGAYNGTSDTELLVAAGSSLGATAVGEITFAVTFDPDGGTGPFFNSATASGRSPQDGVVGDTSDDGEVSDTDGDGNGNEPGSGCPSTDPASNCENDPTPITVPGGGGLPQVGLAKVAAGLLDNGDGTFSVTFTLIVENLGDVDLTSLEVVDDLAAAFPAPASVVGVTPPFPSILTGTGTLNVNPAYDGVTDTVVLLDTSSLDVDSSGQVQFDVIFDPGGETLFLNSATADGNQGDTGDTSDDGTDPDTDGDGNPNEPGENDPTPIEVGGPPVVEVPLLDGRGLALLALVLGALGLALLRRSS